MTERELKSAERSALCRWCGVISEDERHVFNRLRMARCLPT